MTFNVNYQAQVYGRDLGLSVAASMTRFNPDSNWRKVQP